jgi:hypothetical protein
MQRGLPDVAEERWLAVAARLRDAIPQGSLQQETGGWRGTGPLARSALFVLGVVAAALVLGLVGLNDEAGLLMAGLLAVGAAEWLKFVKRLHASGIEEGLCLAGCLMLGIWLVTLRPDPAFGAGSLTTLMLILAVALAGLRLLNPLITTGAVIALVDWAAAAIPGGQPEDYARAGTLSFLLSLAMTLVALALGARAYRRPSHDRMLDWLVATLPLAACAKLASWGYLGSATGVSLVGVDWPLRVVILLVVGTILLSAGLRRRRHAPLVGSLACLVGLAIELRFAAHLSNEAWLITCGVTALLVGAVLDRYLRTTRNGVTSVPQGRGGELLDPLQAAGAAVLAQQSAPGPAPAASAMSGEGGRFGGGGASGSY